MDSWLNVAHVADFPVHTWRRVEVDGRAAIIFHLPDGFHGLQDECSHDGGVLSGGEVADGVVTCPRHGARFDIATGEVLGPPAWEGVPVIPVQVKDGMVRIPDWWH